MSSKEIIIEETKPKYQSDGQEIWWKYKNGEVRITVAQLDNIFYQYSKHGLNMTQVLVQNEHGFSALEWQSLKRIFDLVKNSDVFSPYSLSKVTGKDATKMIASKMAERYTPKNMRAVIVYEDNKQRRKAYDKAIKHEAGLDYRRQVFETGLLDYVTKAKKAPLVRKTVGAKDGHAIVHVCDLHVGANIEEERNLPAFNPGVVAKQLMDIAKRVNKNKPRHVTLVINGDMIETFTGLNHMNSWKNIDERYGYGVSAVIKATELLKGFISAVHNVDRVVLISGNHDRVTSNNKEDVKGEVAMWIHHILQETFRKMFPVEWSKDVGSSEIDGCGFVFTHGHLGISKKNPDHIVNQYGFKDVFNLVIMAHLHTRKVLADHFHNRTIHAPSIFTGNDYSKNLGYSSRAGFLYITVENCLPVVVDYSL